MKIANITRSGCVQSLPPCGRFSLPAWLAFILLMHGSVWLPAEEPADEPVGRSGRLSIDSGDDAPATRLIDNDDATAKARMADPADNDDSASNAGSDDSAGARRGGRAAQIDDDSLQVVVDVAGFKGIRPGQSTRDELRKTWGVPKELKKIDGGIRHTYEIAPFPKVVVTFQGETVAAIVIYLEKPITPELLARQLQIDGTVPVRVPNERGQLLGEAYPERGVLFAFAPDQSEPHVLQVVLEPIDAQPFLLRAETRCSKFPAHSLADADFVLGLEPKNARAHWLRAQSLVALGRFNDALQAAQQAFIFAPAETEYRLTLANVMTELGDYKHAVQHLEELISSKHAPPTVEARAYCLWADCLGASERHDYQKAMQHHQQAIKLAEPLTSNANVNVRRTAKEIMVDAHLGVARDIAFGRWQQKNKVVPKWISRAKAFADDLLANEQADEAILERVHENAMSILVSVPDAPSAVQWIAATKRLGAKLISEAEPQRRGILEWHLGLALSDALLIEQTQGRPTEATELGELAATLLDSSRTAAEQVPTHDFIAGRLCYRLGAIAAMDRQDHKAAVVWYGKAMPLLESPVPASALTDTVRQGDMFVSMAVSYWETGAHEQSLRLTQQGVQLLEQAVEEGIASRNILAVPYGNLSTMFGDMGDDARSQQYSELAKRCEQTTKTTRK